MVDHDVMVCVVCVVVLRVLVDPSNRSSYRVLHRTQLLHDSRASVQDCFRDDLISQIAVSYSIAHTAVYTGRYTVHSTHVVAM